MGKRRSIGSASSVALLAGMSAYMTGAGGCYRHVVGAKGPGASAYEIQERADENTVVVSDLKPAPKPTLTKGGKPVDQ